MREGSNYSQVKEFQEAELSTPLPHREGQGGESGGVLQLANDNEFLQQLVIVIENCIANGNCNVETIASQMSISTNTLRRRLVSITGETPKTYILAIQMQMAKKLLSEPHPQSITDIAHQCGFDDASNFSRVFKRTYGIAPSKVEATS